MNLETCDLCFEQFEPEVKDINTAASRSNAGCEIDYIGKILIRTIPREVTAQIFGLKNKKIPLDNPPKAESGKGLDMSLVGFEHRLPGLVGCCFASVHLYTHHSSSSPNRV